MLGAFEHADRPRRYASVSSDGRLSVFDTATSTLSNSFARPTHLTSRWTCVAWRNHDEAEGMLAMGNEAGMVVIWDIARGEIVHELQGHTQAVHDVAFCHSASGALLLSAGEDRLVCCWDVKSGEQTAAHKSSKAAVHRLALTSTSTSVMLGSSMLRLVTLRDWKRVGRLAGHAEAVKCLCFSPDDKLVASSSGERHISLWHTPPSPLGDGCLQSLALEKPVKAISFCKQLPPSLVADGVYVFLALTAAGVLLIWKLELPSAAKKGKKKAAAQPVLSTTPDCCVRVARDPAKEESSDEPRILSASFCSGGEVMVGYGSEVKPTFVQVRFVKPDGSFVPTVELARAAGGLFDSKSPKLSAKKSPKLQGKRAHDDVQLLGAMDMALPAAARRKGEHGELAAATTMLASEDGAAGGEMPSFGQRLSAMEAATPHEQGGKTKRPTTASQVALLVQALQNGDAAMLDQALATQDAASITSTVARLPAASVIPLLEAVLQRIQGKPARVATLASWLRALLAQHAAYLMSCQQLLPLLTPLYQLIDERLSVFKPLLKLVGRMQMLQSQIAAHAASGQMSGAASADPSITYDEAEEVEAEGEEEDEDEEDEDDEDDEDDEGEEEEDDDEDEEGDDDDEEFGY